MADHRHQPLAGLQQTPEHRGAPPLQADLLGLLALGVARSQLVPGDQIVLRAGIGGQSVVAHAAQLGGQLFAGILPAVVDVHLARHGLDGLQPFHQPLPVGVAAHARQLADLGPHLDLFSEQPHVGGSFHQSPAQSAHRLVAHKQNGAFRPPEVVFQVMLDPARLAHAAGRQNHLAPAVGVDGLGLLAGHRQPQTGAADGVDALFQQIAGFGVEVFPVGVVEDAGGLHGQGAVHIHREILVALHQPVLLDLPQEIEHLLGAAHRKAGHHQIAPPVKGALEHPGQVVYIVGPGAVAAAAVGGFHHHHVGLGEIAGVVEQRLVEVAHVAGEGQGLLFALLLHPDLDAGRAQQMAHVGEPHRNALAHRHHLAVAAGGELLHGVHRVLHRVEGQIFRQARPLCLAVAPFGFKFLDMARIPQHDVAQVGGGPGAVNGTPEALPAQKGKPARVVDVGVGQQHRVHIPRRQGQFGVFVFVGALFQPAVDEDVLSVCLQQRAAAGYLVSRAQKGEFHSRTILSRGLLPQPLLLLYGISQGKNVQNIPPDFSLFHKTKNPRSHRLRGKGRGRQPSL